MMFSGSGATHDSCSQQPNSAVLRASAAACTSRQLQPLPSSGSYLLATGTGSLSPAKPSHVMLPQALKLPQPPHILTSFGALSLKNLPAHKQCPARAALGWAYQRCLLLPRLCDHFWDLQLGMGRARGECPAQLHGGLPPASSGQQHWGPAAERGSFLLPMVIPGLQASSGEGWGATGSVTCRKTNAVRRSCSLQATHGGTELMRWATPIGFRMATASKSSCLL